MTFRRSIRSRCAVAFVALLLLAASRSASAVNWFPFGPDGGDARAFAEDPNDHRHIYLGTLTGWIYDSHDGGAHWSRLARVGGRDDLALDSIIVDPSDPRHILVGAWVIDHPDGGIYISHDAGKTWTISPQMDHHSIRSFTNAPSNPKILVAGALDGVYRSTDGGNSWKLISPPGSSEIHEIESLAIDPHDPSIIYAGTWHLPWKTTDGGANWHSIKQGIIDDSDVFSIIIDPVNSKTVYASACSGIYKSDDAGDRFTKVQGIPSTARRTRVLMQDPKHADIVFAGTTEGLFRTADAGKTWLRNTPADMIINDVFIDPEHTDHMLLATDRGGVLVSEDGGFTFRPSNAGFSARQVSSYAASYQNPANLAVGVLNHKSFGGVFFSPDGGLTWSQQSDGLMGRDVFTLLRTADDVLLAGTSHGIFRYRDGLWVPSGLLLNPVTLASRPALSRTSAPVRRGVRPRAPSRYLPPAPAVNFDGTVYALAASGNTVYAAAGDSLVVSATGGDGWQTVKALQGKEWRYLAVEGNRVAVGGLHILSLSKDGGKTWQELTLPSNLSMLTAIGMDGAGGLWAGGREGLAVSSDDGATWKKIPGLYIADVNNIFYDPSGKRMLLTVNRPTLAYSIALPSFRITYLETGWNLRFLRPVGDHLLGATLFDGIVLEPRMVNSAEVPSRP
jgi:photosystem II stability/assembly factor-like uncharacterized protein